MESAQFEKEGDFDALTISTQSIENSEKKLVDEVVLQEGTSTSTSAAKAQIQYQQVKEPQADESSEETKKREEAENSSQSQNTTLKVLEKKPMNEQDLLIFKDIVQLIFAADLDSLLVTLSKHPPDLIDKLLNKRDEDGASPLFLAVKLAHKNPEQYQKIVEILMNYGANARRPDKDLWTCMHEAIEQRNRNLGVIILNGTQLQTDKQRPRLLKLKQDFDAQLELLPNFSFELCYGVDSSFIPLINRMTPSDRIKIIKYKKHVRFESTFGGYEGISIIRRDIKSVYNPVYRPGDKGNTLPPLMRQVVLFVGDQTKKYTFPVVTFDVVYLFFNTLKHPLTAEEQVQYTERWIQRQQKKKEKGKEDRWRTMRIHEVSFAESKGFFGGLKQEQMFGFDTQKFDLKLVYDFISMERQSQLFNSNFNTYWEQNASFFALEDVSIIDRINYDKYNKENVLNELIQDLNQEVGSYQSKALKLKAKDTKRSTLGIWVTKNYPLKFRDLKMLIKTMMNQLESDSQAEVLKHLDVLLQDRNLTQFMDLENVFPVKLQVPLGYSLYADITFQNFTVLENLDEDQVSSLFSVPQDYEYIERMTMAQELGIGEDKKDKKSKSVESKK